MWWGSRLGRGDFIFAIIALNIAFIAALYFLSGGLSLTLDLGTRSTPRFWGSEPWMLTALKMAFDVAFASLCYRRLQDANHPGWYMLALVAALFGLSVLPLVSGVASLVAIAGLVTLLVLPPTIGPNRFGADPRGWKSPEHYREQQERLSKGD